MGVPSGGGKPQDQTFQSGIGVPQPKILRAGWDPAEAPVCDYLTAIKLRKSGGLVESSDPEDLDQDLIVAGQLRTGKFG